ncbi:3-oxoacyl-[acyl-carrier-protein] synthase III C-terminal domain-containing protein [Streptomyces sp. NPDC005899]|uniref:3-oxoacyl-ACP synthase III family protein n=1 Tax=Streptomyces sp. NPDC005899 TaxID=3155716 RepID=UPI0033BFC70F
MEYGMMGFGSALGEKAAVADIVSEYTADTERVLAYGYRNVHRCPPEVGLTDLSVEAARRALKDAGTEPEELDLVVVAITDIPEYLYWDAAASLQARLGAHRAEAVLISQGCAGGITGFDTLAGRFATHPEYRRALFVGANRTAEAYWNRMETHSLLFSDGAAATVVGRGHPRLRWRGADVITDGRYADFFLMEQGGAHLPFMPGDEQPTARDAWDMMEFFDYDSDRFEGFIELMNDRVREVVHRACARVGVEVGDLARVVLLNDNEQTSRALAAGLGVPGERTNLAFSLEHGHFGAADHLLNLQQHRDAGDLAEGDLIALAGMGRGMHWGCAIIEC